MVGIATSQWDKKNRRKPLDLEQIRLSKREYCEIST